jgi:hypothetical protein
VKYVIALLFMVSCCPQTVPPQKTTAVIMGTDKAFNRKYGRTYLKDEHGHYNDVFGVWGDKDDTLEIICLRNGREFRLP